VEPPPHERRVDFVQCTPPANKISAAVLQFPRLSILVHRKVSGIARDGREIKAMFPHQRLEPWMRHDPHVVTRRSQSGAKCYVRTNIALRAGR
jgi:hypothetical protein